MSLYEYEYFIVRKWKKLSIHYIESRTSGARSMPKHFWERALVRDLCVDASPLKMTNALGGLSFELIGKGSYLDRQSSG